MSIGKRWVAFDSDYTTKGMEMCVSSSVSVGWFEAFTLPEAGVTTAMPTEIVTALVDAGVLSFMFQSP